MIQPFSGAQPALALIDHSTGAAQPAANNPKGIYPEAAIVEAAQLTAGLPFTARGAIKVSPLKETPEEIEETPEEAASVRSNDYAVIVKAYTDRRGELSYALLNKDFIKFAKGSKRVRSMVHDGSTVEAIRAHILRSRLETITGNRNLTDAQIEAIVALLDDANPRHVFRELNDELRRLFARRGSGVE